jgi:uncharacterized membrane protein
VRTQATPPKAGGAATPGSRPAGRARPPLSRRIDQFLLRWQARLDSEWSDRVLPWAGTGLLFALLYALALARADNLSGGTVLATFAQAAWLISTGRGAEPTITAEHLLADHTVLIFWPIAWLTGVLPTVATLLAAQSAALAVGIVPLWRLARRVVHLRVGAAAALSVSYGLHPAIQSLNLADFHPQTLAVAPLIAATYFGLEARWRRFWLCCLFVMLCAAELGLVVAGLGILLILGGQRRHGLQAIAAGVGWTLVAVLIVQPLFGTPALIAPEAFGDYGNSAFGALGAMVTHPFQVLGDVFSEADVRLLVGLLAPLLFLPLLAPRFLIPSVPLQFLYLVAAVPLSGSAGAHHLVPTIPFAFVAATFALSRIGRRSVERVLVDRRVLLALVLAAVGFFALDADSSPYRQPWRWGEAENPVNEAIREAADLVGDEQAVRASPAILPLLAERTEVRPFDASVPNASRATAHVSAVVVDERTTLGWSDRQREAFARSMEIREFELVFDEEGILVWVHRS